jgi:hypothetical protein
MKSLQKSIKSVNALTEIFTPEKKVTNNGPFTLAEHCLCARSHYANNRASSTRIVFAQSKRCKIQTCAHQFF